MPAAMRRQTVRVSRHWQPGPTLDYERHIWNRGDYLIAGVDEAGRGAWAGPLVAAAVLLPSSETSCAELVMQLAEAGIIVNDSKQLRPAERELTLELISGRVLISTVALPAATIDAIGLGPANQLALHRAVEALDPQPDHVLVDYFRLPTLAAPATSITKGDERSVAIALASIAAKVYRDQLMRELDERHPGYHFGQHKGYGTQRHANLIDRLGITDHHRRCFRPIHQAASGG